MKTTGRFLEKILIEGKVFKGGATWKKLEKFFEKSQDEILKDLSEIATPEEINFIVEQIAANEHYQKNVRIIDPECLEDTENLPALFALNSKLCSITSAKDCVAAQELKSLNYLWIFSPNLANGSVTVYDGDKELNQKQKDLFVAYDYFNSRGKKVLLVSPNKNTRVKAAEHGINAVAFDNDK